jgi:hypothetical protein
LWTQKLGANDNVRNFLCDFWFYVGDYSEQYGQALEFDTFQFIGGYNYMIGSQCDYGHNYWDTWNETVGQWVQTSIACPKFAPNTWHHIQWYVTTNLSEHQYTYHVLVVDGNGHTVNYTGTAKNLNWGDNLGVQWQLDDNVSGGGYEEWVDESTLAGKNEAARCKRESRERGPSLCACVILNPDRSPPRWTQAMDKTGLAVQIAELPQRYGRKKAI